jgi:plasmid maintenance system antidote protein VapI
MSTCEFAITIPPTPGEWAAMADNHLRALRLAYVIANDSASALVGRRSKRTADMAMKLGQAARFHRAFAELCEMAEKRLIDASL